MEELHLNAQVLRRNPQMAAVGLLANTLKVATEVLIAAHPRESWEEKPREGILAGYAAAILNQIQALKATLADYESEVVLTEPPEAKVFDVAGEIP